MNGTALPHLDVGSGPAIVVLHGYGMTPQVYARTAELLANRARVVIPDLFAVNGRWTFEHTLDALEVTLDDLGIDQVSLLGHSFGGGIELGLAARRPERVVECIFSDTLAVHRELSLALEAVHPGGLARMATRRAIAAFTRTATEHPVKLARAALWAFVCSRAAEIDATVRAGIPCHVLWAERDSILSRDDGADFAHRLQATFTVARRPPGYGPIDHDWMFDDPELFTQHLEELELKAFLR